MKIYKTDDIITSLGKRGAMICHYSIHNPFHVSFEDGNFNRDWDLGFERKWNEQLREKNGERMYQFISTFIDELESLNRDERVSVYKLVRKKWNYLDRKWMQKICKNSKPRDRNICGIAYKHYLAEDGHIYVETDLGIKLLQF